MKKLRLLGIAWACLSSSMPASSYGVAITGQGSWETTLLARDLDGNTATVEAYYDTTLDITWLADANVLYFRQTWSNAMAWADGLDFGGVDDWRLPYSNPIDGTIYDDSLTTTYIGDEDRGYNVSAPGSLYAGSTASELAHLYYNTLGNLAFYDINGIGPQTGWGLTNSGPFINIEPWSYWSATDYLAENNTTFMAWGFTFYDGLQGAYLKECSLCRNVWAVHDGDVGFSISSVPIPASVWLFGSGLLGLIGIARRKAA